MSISCRVRPYKINFRKHISTLNMSKRFSNVASKSPLIVAICGPTGTGKSKLAIEIARMFTGEVVNADALQLHCGLNIATNKVTFDETKDVKHHLLGCLSDQDSASFDIHKYRQICLPVINEIHAQGHLPVLAGGTCYYLEAILWTDFLNSSLSDDDKPTKMKVNSIRLPSTPDECYSLLRTLEPEAAASLHPHNIRRVRKTLTDILYRRHFSNDFSQQQSPVSTDKPVDLPINRSYEPRYPNTTLLLWLDCELDVLDRHLDNRVTKMIESGLLAELDAFANRYMTATDGVLTSDQEGRSSTVCQLFSETESHTTGLHPSHDCFTRRGILQAIGFKEFSKYLSIHPDSRGTPEARQLLTQSIEDVKLATRQYARRQRKWVTNRFIRRPSEGSIPVYRLDVTHTLRDFGLDSTASDHWKRDVLAPACRLLFNLMYPDPTESTVAASDEALRILLSLCPSEASSLPFAEPLSDPIHHGTTSPVSFTQFVCAVCQRTFYARRDWEAHQSGRRHQKKVASAHRKANALLLSCEAQLSQ